ncbi:hypothetical protein ACJRO7_015708 [Eucalyptus globulus]|uniref:Uncharacterized protein n=1 Tax=Eucalyptus globulus TaxID=34317 RepID=A0ABD3L4K4_EUCGL
MRKCVKFCANLQPLMKSRIECLSNHHKEEEEEDARAPGEDGVLGCDEFWMYKFKKGDSCEFAHGVFECWLHPERYRTQACKDGQSCRRRVCLFAHSPDQLRVLPAHQQQQQQQHSPKSATDSEFGSPVRPCAAAAAAFDSYFTKPWSASFISSPTSILTTSSPPISPPTNSSPDLVACMRNVQIAKMKMSPRGQMAERVQSGRDLRAKMYAKLSKENSLDGADLVGTGSGPDGGWVSELVM